MRVVLLLLSITAWLAAGCDEGSSRLRGVTCETNYACTLGGVYGTCQPDGFCAYPDDACAGGLRYSPGATGHESACVGGTCGADGDACCADMSCHAGLACNAGGTCTCGDSDGAPCCTGVTPGFGGCGANLACNASGTCGCGGPGEPCCGGTTCDSGAACAAGTCPATYEKISAGRHFICGLRTDGAVVCWGSDQMRYGRGVPSQLNPVIQSLTPTRIVNATNVAEIDSGESSTCIRKTDNTLWCWGQGSHGQLGNGMMKSSLAAVQVTGLSNVTAFSVGRVHACAIGTVSGVNGIYCWGHNGRGVHGGSTYNASRFGNNAIEDSAVPVAVDMSSMAAAGQTAKLIAAGGYHTCAVMSDDRAWCWGSNDEGALGNNDTDNTLAPVLVDFSQITIPSGVTVDEIAIGTAGSTNNASVIRLSNGTVYAWGSVEDGEGGDGDLSARYRPTTPVTSAAVFTKLAPLPEAMCALDNTGKVWCWGQGFPGQLGNGMTSGQDTPAQVMGLPVVTTLVAGHRIACALDANKRMWCWGNNRKGAITRTIPASDTEAMIVVPVEVP